MSPKGAPAALIQITEPSRGPARLPGDEVSGRMLGATRAVLDLQAAGSVRPPWHLPAASRSRYAVWRTVAEKVFLWIW